MKIEINNSTDYDTGWLRQLLNRAKRMVDRRMRRKHFIREHYKVDVVYKKSFSTWVGGYAYYNGGYVRLKVIRPPQALRLNNWNPESVQSIKERRENAMEEIAKSIANTMVHELYHCYGYKHDQSIMFLPRRKIWVENTYNYDWCSKYPVKFKIEKVKPEKVKTDIQVVKYERVLNKIKEKTSTLKRIQNLLKKYTSKKRYYENILVAAGKLKKD